MQGEDPTLGAKKGRCKVTNLLNDLRNTRAAGHFALAMIAASSFLLTGWIFDTWSGAKKEYVKETASRIAAQFPNKKLPREQLEECLSKRVEPAFEILEKHCSASQFKSLLDPVEFKLAREKGDRCAVAIEVTVQPTNDAIEGCLSEFLK